MPRFTGIRYYIILCNILSGYIHLKIYRLNILMTEVETKKCSKCSKVKSIDDFYKSQCLRCYNYQKKYYEDNKEKVNARIKECKERRPEHYKEKQY